MKKYNLRSSHQPLPEEVEAEMPEEDDEIEVTSPPKRPRCQSPENPTTDQQADTKTETRRNTKPKHSHQLHLKSVSSQTTSDDNDEAEVKEEDEEETTEEAENEEEENTSTKITDLQPEVMDLVCRYCDTKSLLSLYRSCKWFYSMFHESNTFWKLLCFKEELANYPCINDKAVIHADSKSETSDESQSVEKPLDLTQPFETEASGTSGECAGTADLSESGAAKEKDSDETTANMKQQQQKESATAEVMEEAKPSSSSSSNSRDTDKIGFAGRRMRGHVPEEAAYWRKVFLRGVQMRRNIVGGNWEGYRIYANSECPVVKLTPDLDLSQVKRDMGNYPKLSVDDDLKIDWNEQYLVVFHFVRREGESCTIRVWDIENEPKFLFAADKGIECITDKISVVKKSVVMVPSWPIAADALVMTLDIDEETSQMKEGGKFKFDCDKKMRTVDEHWEHTMLRTVREMAVVVLKAPEWQCVIVELPTCRYMYSVNFNEVPMDYECQQIRSYRFSALILFVQKEHDSANCLVTMHIPSKQLQAVERGKGSSKGYDLAAGSVGSAGTTGEPTDFRLRSIFKCSNTFDAALFTDPEEIFLMKKNGDVVQYDPNTNTETVKILNPAVTRDSKDNEYQLFVNRKEQICVMQSSSEVPSGRRIHVYNYDQKPMYTINLDLVKYGLSRDDSICIYTNAAFLAAADSKKFVFFDVKTGRQVGELRIPSHLDRNKAKEEKFCMYDQQGLSLFIFDEDKLVAVHDYERCFPAVLDIYKFW